MAAIATLLLVSLSGNVRAESQWSRGWVKRIVHGADLHDTYKRECLQSLSPENIAVRDFVVVDYGGFRGRRYLTVALPKDLSLVPGEPVWVDLKDCLSPLRKRADIPPW